MVGATADAAGTEWSPTERSSNIIPWSRSIYYISYIIYYIYIILTKFPRALSDDPKEMTYSQKLCYFRGSASAVHAEEAGVGGKVFNTRFISPYCIFCRFV